MAKRPRADFPTAESLLDTQKLQASAQEFARIVVAVSGGADSMALLCALHEMRASNSMELRVVHANHQTRADSNADEEFVRGFCQDLGVELYVDSRQTAALSGQVSEAELRSFRYEVYRKALGYFEADAVVLGHTSDDLVETLLMNLIRGAGLGAYRYSYKSCAEGMTVLRPFWKTSRTALLQYLEGRGIQYREDSSNQATAYTRNRVRHVLLPLIEKEFNPNARESLLRSAETVGAAQEFISHTAKHELDCREALPGSPPAVARDFLLDHPEAVATEMIRQLLVQFQPTGIFVSHEQIRECYEALQENEVRVVQLPAGVYAVTGKYLWFGKQGGTGTLAPASHELALAYARMFHLPLAKLRSAIPLTSSAPVLLRTFDGEVKVRLDRAEDQGASIRNRHPGDRLPSGVRLKDVLVNDKCPFYVRDYLVIVATESGEVLHVIGLPRVNGRILTQSGFSGVSVEISEESSDDKPCDTGR